MKHKYIFHDFLITYYYDFFIIQGCKMNATASNINCKCHILNVEYDTM